MNILIIDDSITTRTFLKTTLTNKGHNVSEAENGVVGLIKINREKPNLVILDLLMPEMDGFEVLEKLKRNRITIPIIVLTADIQDDVKEECLQLGAKVVLNKPFSETIIIETINSLKL